MYVTDQLVMLFDLARTKRLTVREVRLDEHSHMRLGREGVARDFMSVAGHVPTFNGLPIITEHRRGERLPISPADSHDAREGLAPALTVIALGCQERGDAGRWVYLDAGQ